MASHAGAEFWDRFHRERLESGDDLDWGDLWTRPFLGPLRDAGVSTILEVGCGTGNDAARLADVVTRTVFAEVGRLVRSDGLFVFHVNALEDRPLRARWMPARELEPDYVLEESGQTMHFFSEPYLRELLGGWQELRLTSVPIPHRETGEAYKHVWRGIARRLKVSVPPALALFPGRRRR